MLAALFNGRVLTDAGVVDGKAVLIRNGKIAGLVDTAQIPSEAERRDLDGGLLVPGYIDTQVNGGGGVLFNDSPTVEAIAAIGAAHRRYGTTGFLPTLISDDLSVVDQALRATEQAIAQGAPGVLGIHIEGPFLSPKRKGIHDADKFRVIDDEALALLSSLKVGKTLVTLAPERTTPEMIQRLASAGGLRFESRPSPRFRSGGRSRQCLPLPPSAAAGCTPPPPPPAAAPPRSPMPLRRIATVWHRPAMRRRPTTRPAWSQLPPPS